MNMKRPPVCIAPKRLNKHIFNYLPVLRKNTVESHCSTSHQIKNMYRAFLNLPMIENIINFGLRKKIFSRAKKRMPLEDLEIAYICMVLTCGFICLYFLYAVA